MFSSSSDNPSAPYMKLQRKKQQRFYIPRTSGLLDTVLSSSHARDEEGGPSTLTLLSDCDRTVGRASVVVPEVQDDSGELRRARHLASRYSLENAQLRDQLKAYALRESLLTERLQTDHAARLKCVEDPSENRVSDNQNNKAGQLCASREHAVECAPPTHREQLEAKEKRIRELELRICGLEGRLKAYEEAFQRGSSGTSSSRPECSPTTHELICQCLSGMEYLVKVCNAVEHCRNTPHGCSECPRPQRQCVLHCLRAAMRGNIEPAADVLARGHQINDHELMLSLREEIEYCETALVRIAAQLFAEYSQSNPSPTNTVRHQEDKLGSASGVEKSEERVSGSVKRVEQMDTEDCAVQ